MPVLPLQVDLGLVLLAEHRVEHELGLYHDVGFVDDELVGADDLLDLDFALVAFLARGGLLVLELFRGVLFGLGHWVLFGYGFIIGMDDKILQHLFIIAKLMVTAIYLNVNITSHLRLMRLVLLRI